MGNMGSGGGCGCGSNDKNKTQGTKTGSCSTTQANPGQMAPKTPNANKK